jgi:hypothetical protein
MLGFLRYPSPSNPTQVQGEGIHLEEASYFYDTPFRFFTPVGPKP